MAIQSLYQNGGYIGVTRDFANTNLEQPLPVYVGGQTNASNGSATAISVTFSLNGGISGDIATTPQAGDVVVVCFTVASTVDRAMVVNSSTGVAYTNAVELYANSTFDTNLCVAYRVMPSTPDTGITFPSGTFATTDAGAYTISVWRYIDTTTPLDVVSTTTTSATSALAIPPAITTSTNGSIILAASAAAHNGGADTFSSAQLSFFGSSGGNSTNDSTVGVGAFRKDVAGTFTPTVFTFSQADSTTFSSAAATIALRPLYPTGRRNNYGIWNLQSAYEKESTGLSIVSSTVYSQSTDGITHWITLPSSMTVGNLLLMFMTADATCTASISADYGTWTQEAFDSTYDEAYIFAKIVDDVDIERGYIRVDLSATNNLCATIYNITGNSTNISDVVVSAPSLAATASPDPPYLQTTWQPTENLFFVAAHGNDGNMTLTSYPSLYTLGQTFNRSTVGGTGSTVITAAQLKDSTEINPGTFATVTSRSYATYSLAVKPKMARGVSTTTLSGGTVTTSGSYRIHTFTSTDILIVNQPTLVEYLIVGGGGGGGSLLTAITTHAGGGGGAGGMLTGTMQIEPGEYVIAVGAGGPANTSGADSSFYGIVANSGGHGGYPSTSGGFTTSQGMAGASGGGSSNYSYVGTNPGGQGTAGQGNDGGTGTTAAGGGGGASAAGSSVTGTAGGAGGAGSASSISGASVTYAGGGGGGATTGAGGAGGAGGGGTGSSGVTAATNGTANRGAGGGGARYNTINAGGTGGSGIVIVRYAI